MIDSFSDSAIDQDAADRLFHDGFDELCAWLLSILERGSLVPLTDVSLEYERILHRRQEKCTESMLRTTNLRMRLESKCQNVLHFQKLNNYEVRVSNIKFFLQEICEDYFPKN